MTNLFNILTRINDQYPHLLRTNTKATDAEFLLRVVQAAPPSEKWGLLSKSGGENGYTWPNNIRTSHDAIALPSGERVDIIGAADNPGIPGSVTWQVVPPSQWRPSNTWVDISRWEVLIGGDPVKPPVDPVIIPPKKLGYEDLGGDAFFIREVGHPIANDHEEANQSMNEGTAVWFSRIYFSYFHEGMTIKQAVRAHRYGRGELRDALGLGPNE